MVSMKTTDGSDCCINENEYGYGLLIRLNDEQCKALGIKEPPRAGTQVKITALAFVQSTTESVEGDDSDKSNDVNLSLQITDMELSDDTKSSAQRLFKDMNA
jgi:hypothetical protein